MEEKIRSLLAEFKTIASHPEQAVADHLAQTGKGAIGMMPIYAPEELVHATGFLPVGLWGGSRPVAKARTYLPPFACSIMQQVMELECEGVYDGLAAVVFSVPCDTLKCMSQKWKGTSPVLVFTHPQNRGLEAANRFLEREYAILQEKLETITGVKITNAALENSIRIYNENRAAMREFSALAAQYPQVISAVDRHAVFKARLFLEKSRHTAMVRELMEAVRASEPQPWTGKRVVVTGILLEPDGLLELFDRLGLAIAADDLAQESRQYRTDTPEKGGGALKRLALQWNARYGCSLIHELGKPRGKMLAKMCQETGAQGVISCMMKFCDPEEYDEPYLEGDLRNAGYPVMAIEVDPLNTNYEQLRTRVQTFCELL